MARKRALTDEQIWVMRQAVGDKTIQEYAKDFGVSYATAYNAKKGIGHFGQVNFSNKFEEEMLQKYFPVGA